MRYQTGFLLMFLAFCRPASAGDWPNWRGPNHNGISEETGWQSVWPAAGPKRLWRASVGTGFASVSVSEGRVFTLGNDDNTDTLYCFDAGTGDILWKHAYQQQLAPKYYEGGPSATPTVAGDSVFTFSKSGGVRCIGASSGALIWKKDLATELKLKEPAWGFAGSPLVQGDRVIFNAGDSGVALDKRSGAVVWRSPEGPAGYSTPVPFPAGDQPGLALMGKDALIAVRADLGTVLWRYSWETRYDVNAADPVIVGGDRFFITSGYNHGCALVQVTGGQPALLWENKHMRSQITSPVLWKGHLYGVDDNQLVCLDVETGRLKWTDRSVGKGSLMIADGKLIVLSEKGELSVAEPSPAGFKPISRAQVLSGRCWTVPVLCNGRMYCRNASGDLVCLDVAVRP